MKPSHLLVGSFWSNSRVLEFTGSLYSDALGKQVDAQHRAYPQTTTPPAGEIVYYTYTIHQTGDVKIVWLQTR